MTLWDEKPGIDTLTVVWDDPNADPRVRTYNPDLMDPWLERVQAELERLEAVKSWLVRAKAEGRVSMSVGFSLGLVLGVEKDD